MGLLPVRAEVVVVGAGIAGISAAYRLALAGQKDVLIVDPLPPLSLTSDKSTECYRNFWPGPDGAMAALMSRSIDLLEESAEAIRMNRRGYLFVTDRAERVGEWIVAADQANSYGGGEVRVHEAVGTYRASAPEGLQSIDGVDIVHDANPLFPYLKPGASAMHIRRAGWLKSDLLGRLWLDKALEMGVRLVRGEVIGIELTAGRVSGVAIRVGEAVSGVKCGVLVNAAGPLCADVAALVGLEMPVFSELHLKLNFRDKERAMPRNAPLVIGDDPIELPWRVEEREALSADPAIHFLSESFPKGVHGRPEGGPNSDAVLLLWTYHLDAVKPSWPIVEPPFLAESVVRGMSTVIPAFRVYQDHFDRPILDGGYYTKTRENRPLIGPTSVTGYFLSCGYSGYGIMAAAASGELLAQFVLGLELPSYAGAFRLDRYEDEAYRAKLDSWVDTAQL